MKIDQNLIVLVALVGAFIVALALTAAVVLIARSVPGPRRAVDPPPPSKRTAPAPPAPPITEVKLPSRYSSIVGGPVAQEVLDRLLDEQEELLGDDGHVQQVVDEAKGYGIVIDDIHNDKRYEDA